MTNAERQKRWRERNAALRKGAVNVTESVTVGGESVTGVTAEITETDRKFLEEKPGYYIIEDGEAWDRKCWQCGKEYSTRLELNKFCSPECKNAYLKEAFGKIGEGIPA